MKLLNFAFFENEWIKQMSNIDNILTSPTNLVNYVEDQAI